MSPAKLVFRHSQGLGTRVRVDEWRHTNLYLALKAATKRLKLPSVTHLFPVPNKNFVAQRPTQHTPVTSLGKCKPSSLCQPPRTIVRYAPWVHGEKVPCANGQDQFRRKWGSTFCQRTELQFFRKWRRPLLQTFLTYGEFAFFHSLDSLDFLSPLSLWSTHSLPPTRKVFTSSLSSTQCSQHSASDQLIFSAFPYYLSSAIPLLKKPLSFGSRSSICCIAFQPKYDSSYIFGRS